MNNLDRLVGVKVFGWSIVADSDGEPIWSNDCGTPLAFQYASAPVKFGPNFSTEIAAAWEVVRNLRGRRVEPYEDPWTFQIVDSFTTDVRKWSASVGTVGFRFSHGGEHEDECMAICLAALRAVGVPESEIQEAMR